MAAGTDEIIVLDGIQFAKDTSDYAWTLDGDGSANEVVKSYAVVIPPDISGARVIFNGLYDPDGARCHVRCRVTKMTDASTPTKTENTQALEWTVVQPDGSPAVVETGEIDLSASFASTLHIDVALTEDAVASTGLEVIVQVQHEADVDEWSTLTRFIGPTGTPSRSAFSGAEASGQTALLVTNPTAEHFVHVGKFIFLEDVNTIANCEIAYLIECGADS